MKSLHLSQLTLSEQTMCLLLGFISGTLMLFGVLAACVGLSFSLYYKYRLTAHHSTD